MCDRMRKSRRLRTIAHVFWPFTEVSTRYTHKSQKRPLKSISLMKTNEEQNSSACKFIFRYGQVQMSINDRVYRADKLKNIISWPFAVLGSATPT